METINLYGWEIDLLKDILRAYAKGERPCFDEEYIAKDLDKRITEQYPDYVIETGLLSGKPIKIEII